MQWTCSPTTYRALLVLRMSEGLSVLGAGRHQMPFASMSAILGGNVRVGLEDNLYASRGKLATSNAERVGKIRRILEELGMEIANPAEARAMLTTKGGDNVAL